MYYRNTSNTSAAFDSEVLGPLGSISASGNIPRATALGGPTNFSGSASFTVPALSVGSHTVRFVYVTLGGNVQGSPVTGSPSNTSPLPITIIAAPVVQLYFSFSDVIDVLFTKLFASS
jgi:hypothetical protein